MHVATLTTTSMPGLTKRRFAAALFCLTMATASSAAAATVAAQSGDASITHDTEAGTWILSAGGATLALALDPSRNFSILSLMSPSGKPWTTSPSVDTFLKIGNQTLSFGVRAAGFSYQDASVDTVGNKLTLNAVFDLASAGLRVTRHYAIVPGSPSFEVWTTYAPRGGTVTMGDLNAIQMTIPAGTINWLTGLQGDTADVANDSAFTLEKKTLAVGQQFAVGATYRASEQTVPWFAIDGAQDEFYAALMWTGAWSLGFDRTGTGLALTFGLAPMSTTITQPIDGPHVVFGVAAGGLAEAAAALRSYALTGIREGRALTPLVTYNTWFAYGVDIDEASMRAEMQRVAQLGVELFVIDAGWYSGTGVAGPFDFDAGLGGWTPDPARFPNGLKPLTDYAHRLGMKFGIWVEPERTNLSLVGAGGG